VGLFRPPPICPMRWRAARGSSLAAPRRDEAIDRALGGRRGTAMATLRYARCRRWALAGTLAAQVPLHDLAALPPLAAVAQRLGTRMIAEKDEHHGDERAGAGTQRLRIGLVGSSGGGLVSAALLPAAKRDRVVEVCPNGCADGAHPAHQPIADRDQRSRRGGPRDACHRSRLSSHALS
jgi:hypothetical protein